MLLAIPEMQRYLGPYDHHGLSHTWKADHPMVDQLQKEAARLAEECADGRAPADTLTEMWSQVAAAAGRAAPRAVEWLDSGPHLTEPWFCCAEPTMGQKATLGMELIQL